MQYRVYRLEYPTQEKLAKAFLRLEEFYESLQFRGTVFTIEEFVEWYTQRFGAFTYYSDWAGFNLPSTAIEMFRRRSFPDLTIAERGILSATIRLKCPYYLIATFRGDARALATTKHEYAHAMYFLSACYRRKVQAYLATLPLWTLRRQLERDSYHPARIRDESHAYLLTGMNNYLLLEKVRRKAKYELDQIFRHIFGFSLVSAGEKEMQCRIKTIKT